jgi:omega-6 fatty acid desaturase (delta-12 desaturase)
MTETTSPRGLRERLASYQRPHLGRSVLEIAWTAVPLAALWIGALVAVSQGLPLLGLALTPIAAMFLVRMFMIQHDCGHAAFFSSRQANEWTGRVIGVLTMTPYDYWRRTHAIHHATSGNLDRRSLGAVEMLTVEEYRAKSRLQRAAYRLYRNPLVMFGLGPGYMFVLQHRLPVGLMREPGAWLSVMGNSLGLAVLVAVQLVFGGWQGLVLVHLPIVVMAAAVGVWLFYVQHQFEGAYWARNKDWTYETAALNGSSHLDLPAPLRWLTANIGVHHIHHVGCKIPFYRLPQVLRDFPSLKGKSRITLADVPGTVRLALWDEVRGRLVSFREERRERKIGGLARLEPARAA